MPTTHQIRSRLRAAVQDLSMRGLKQGAAWAAELLTGLGDANTTYQSLEEKGRNEERGVRQSRKLSSKGHLFDEDEGMWPEQQSNNTDLVLVAKTFYDLGEYQRCAGVLSPT